MQLCHWDCHKDVTLIPVMRLSFISLCHWVMWLSSTSSDLNPPAQGYETKIWIFPRLLFFKIYQSPMNQFSQTTELRDEVSGWCHLAIRQSMPYSAQVPCRAILVGSCLGETSCHGPWWWESKCLSSWIWRWDQQLNETWNNSWFTWLKIPLGVQSEDFGNFMQFCCGNCFKWLVESLGDSTTRSLLLALWRWLASCSLWWVLPCLVWCCRKPLGGWWSSQGPLEENPPRKAPTVKTDLYWGLGALEF